MFLFISCVPDLIILTASHTAFALQAIRLVERLALSKVKSADRLLVVTSPIPLSSRPRTRFLPCRPFGLSCGSPRVNAKLYPTVMSEMARALRPGTGRAVLLVTQPHLLGLPETQRERTKDNKKKKRFKGMRRPQERGIRQSQNERELKAPGNEMGSTNPSECDGGRDGKASCVDAVSGEQQAEMAPCNNEGVGGQASHDLKSCDLKSAPEGVAVGALPQGTSVGAFSQGAVMGASEGGSAVVAPPALWQLRARHAVNIGGLISWLLVLGRTDEPPPPPRKDRRNRFVGMKSYCKRRKDGHLV